MACCANLYRMYQFKKKLDSLELAKVNAKRERMGLPPLRAWYKQWWDEKCQAVRFYFIRNYFPWMEEVDEGDPAYWERFPLCKNGTPHNDLAKVIIAYVASCILSMAWFVVMVYQLNYYPKTAAIACIVIDTVLVYGLAYSKDIRCITLLIIPGLCSSKGRTLLLAYAFVLVLTHPAANFKTNMHVMADSLTCGQQLAVNATKEVIGAALSPAKSFMGQVREILQTLVEFAEQLRETFEKVQALYQEIADRIEKVFGWLKDMVNICNKNMGKPHDKCRDAFNQAYQKCRRKVPTIFRFTCKVVSGTKGLCDIVKVGELLCKITKAIKEHVVGNIKNQINIVMNDIYEMFYFKVELHYHYNVTLTQSKSFASVRTDIQNDIERRLKPLKAIGSVTSVITVLLLFWVVLKAVIYRRKYLSIDHYDNMYITKYLNTVDERRREMKKETLLPLEPMEAFTYIESNSFLMSSAEIKKLVIGGLLFLGAFFHAFFYMACDYGTYWLLHMIETKGRLVYEENVPSHLKMHVDGEGVLADMYRAIISQFDPFDKEKFVVDTRTCLPHPSEPNWGIYGSIYFIFALCFLLVLIEAYLLRLRHIICGYYYPEREKERIAWLYSHILRKRGNFYQTGRYVEDDRSSQDQEGLLLRISARCPLFSRLLYYCGFKHKVCISCGISMETNDPRLIRCDNPNCKVVYCQKCFEKSGNQCIACFKKVDYGRDTDDDSEEVDSSDEEEIV